MTRKSAGDLFNLAGRRALVTGSTSGIGYAIAAALGGAGAKMILNGRSEARLDAAAAQLRADGIEVETACFDVTNPTVVTAAVQMMEARGPIDITVNNAGIQHRGPLDRFNDDHWRELIATNIDSLYYVSKAIAPGMIARGRGKIINIGSVQCEYARPGIAPYAATKGAVRNLTRGMCADWARFGLQINAIAPGYFQTPLNQALADDPAFDSWLRGRTPAQRWGQLDDLHGIAVFLASDASNFINGQTIFVDGGITAVL